jgi:hypothetical protein
MNIERIRTILGIILRLSGPGCFPERIYVWTIRQNIVQNNNNGRESSCNGVCEADLLQVSPLKQSMRGLENTPMPVMSGSGERTFPRFEQS